MGGRCIVADVVRLPAALIKRCLQGMGAGQLHHGFDYARLLPRFQKGELDGAILGPASPAVAGGWWLWAKEVQVAARVAVAACACL